MFKSPLQLLRYDQNIYICRRIFIETESGDVFRYMQTAQLDSAASAIRY